MTQSISINAYHTLNAIHIGEHSAVYALSKQASQNTDTGEQQADFAIKIAITPIGASRIEQEISLLNTLPVHQQILRPIETGKHNGMTYFILPYCELNLRSYLRKQIKPLEPSQAIDILRELGRPLGFLHDKGLVHGDISPNNFLLHSDNSDETSSKWCLIDFACAVEIATEHFPESRPKRSGTPGFVSPEQRGGMLQLSPQSDIFGLSAILVFLLSGQEYENDEARIACLTQQQCIASNPALVEVLKRGLSTAAKERFASVADFLDAVWEAIKSEGIKSGKGIKPTFAESYANQHESETLTDAGSTQDFSAHASLSKPLQTLKQEIISILKDDGHLASLNTQALATKYGLNEKVDQADLVVQSLIDEAIEHLSQDDKSSLDAQYPSEYSKDSGRNYGHFLRWSFSLKTFKDKHGKELSQQQFEQFIQQGLKEGAGTDMKLRLCLQRHFKVNNGASNINKGLLLTFIGVIVAFAFMQFFSGSSDDEKVSKAPISNLENSLSDASSEPSINAITNERAKLVFKQETTEEETKLVPTEGNINSEAPKIKAPRPEDESVDTKATLNKNRLSYSLKDAKTQQVISFDLVKVPDAVYSENTSALFVMTTEVSQGLWQACVHAGKCRSSLSVSTSESRKLLMHDDHPAVNVSWYDIQEDFIPFLNESLNTTFALPTMAQWLSYSFINESRPDWPNTIQCRNCRAASNSGFANTSMPVNSLQPSSKGLYHVYGNAQEWLQDCWQDVKLKRERCDQAPAVGGSWRDDRQTIEQKPFVRLLKTARSTTTGFRLVKRENIN